MRAWRVHEYGPFSDVLKLEEVADPEPPDAGVVLEVAAAHVNFFDILAIAGNYQVKVPPPFVPGSEAAGTVIAAGSKSRFAVGDRLIGTNIAGAFAQKMIVPDGGCFRVPEGMDDAKAAAYLISYQTSYFALAYRASLQAGETVLVHGGAGGVGTAAIQIGKALGATVIATARSPDKLEVCRTAGAAHVIDHRNADFVTEVKKLTGGRGADIIYDPVGGDVFDKSTKCIAWEGRLVVIGFASGRIPQIQANRILLKNVSVVGLNWGGYQMRNPKKIATAHEALGAMFAKNEVDPVVYGDYGLDDLPNAMKAIENRQSHGNVVVRM